MPDHEHHDRPAGIQALLEQAFAGADLDSVVRALTVDAASGHAGYWNPCDTPLPSRDRVIEAVEALRSVLFPGFFGHAELSPESVRFHVGATLDTALATLQEQVRRGLCFACQYEHAQCQHHDRTAVDITRAFLSRLPEVKRLLDLDVRAHFEGDPAAIDPDEAIFCYPGLQALIHHRLAHELYALNVPLIPRIINERAHSQTGIDIHPGATIGESCFIDHGTGVVIGETAILGRGVRLYQGVTLGAKSFPLDDDGNPIKGIARHPVVEDGVIIYSGATILGRITIGRGSVIGGNVWVVRDVPPDSRLTQSPARTEEYEGGGGI